MYRKELFYRGLDQLPVYIEDTLQNSPYYFNIVDIPKVFGPGKNSIRFNLNENNLDIYNDVDVEIIDSYGNTVYHEAPEYFQRDEENIRVLTVFLYDNISNGPLRITFIGHAKTGLNGEPIPSEFQNKYNVRYTTIVDFNRFQKNTSRILFSQDPSISISEARTAYVSRSLSPLDTITVSGSGTYRYQQSYPLLELPQAQSFTNDMLNGTLILTGSSILPDFSGYTTSSFNIFNSRISNIYNSQVAILNIPWTASILGQGSSPSYGVVNNANVNYTLTYSPTPNYTPINNFKSFINLKISNLDPASGYLKYIKLYGKSQGSLDQYELLGESQTIDNELLINSSSYTQFDRSNVGYFLNTSSFQSFWNYNNTYLSASFNTSSLFNSLYLNPQVDTTLNNVLFTSNVDINFQKESSYRLYFNYVKDTNFILEVYMSGSAFINKEGNGQRVFYLDSSNFGPSYLNFPIDFLAPQTGTGRLQFKIITGSFYISDISLKSGVDQGFNPSNFNSYFPINVKNRDDVYDFKVDFIDDNNQINSYEFDNIGASNIQVSGSNQYISGCDNLIPGCIRLGNSLQQGIHLDGQNNQVTTYNNSTGWVMWSGSQTISGSSQPGSGFYFETGAPYNHYIKATVGGQIQISGSVSGATGGTSVDTGSFVTTSSFNSFTSSINNFTSSINGFTSSLVTTSSFNNFTSSINNFTSSINNITGSFATTGSNTFNGTQIITGSLSNGLSTIALGNYSHAEGDSTIANGDYSHAEGFDTNSNGYASHAEGNFTIAQGDWSHAEGFNTIAQGNYSHAEGIGTIASGSGQTVVGKYNKQNNTSSLFIIGNGTANSNRNDLVLFNTSSVEISGSLIVNNQTLPAINTLILNTQTGSFTTTSSFNTYTSSINSRTGSFVTTGSFNAYTASVQNSLNGKANLAGGNTFAGAQIINGNITISGSNDAYISNTGNISLPGGSTTTTVYLYEGTSYVGGLFNIHIQKSTTQFSLYNMLVANDESLTNTTYNIIASASFGDEVNTNTTIIADMDGGTKTRIRITNDDSADYSVRIFPTLISI
jgi:hypothetical protein